MNKYRLNQILSILLMPYIQKAFYKDDYLAKVGATYYRLYQTKAEDYTERKKYKSEYDGARQKLIDFLCSDNTRLMKSVDDVLLFLELYYPKNVMLKNVQDFVRKGGSRMEYTDAICDCYFNNLFRIANSLLTFRDGILSIRTWKNAEDPYLGADILGVNHAFDKVEIWNTMNRIMATDVLTAAFYILAELDQRQIASQTGEVSLADSLLAEILKKGLAEIHLHMNAGFRYNFLWILEMDPDVWREWEFKGANQDRLYKAMVFRIIVAQYLEYLDRSGQKGTKDSFCRFVFDVYSSEGITVWNLLLDMKDGKVTEPSLLLQIRDILGRKWIPVGQYSGRGRDFLLDTVFGNFRHGRASSEIILLYKLMKHLRCGGDYLLMKLFIQYLRIKNDYFSELVQESAVLGLDYFQRFFNRSKKEMKLAVAKEDIFYKIILKSLMEIENIRKIEMRIAPEIPEHYIDELNPKIFQEEVKRGIKDYIRKILKVYRDYIYELLLEKDICIRIWDEEESRGDYLKVFEEQYGMETLKRKLLKEPIDIPVVGIVFHFIKMRHTDNSLGDACWLKYAAGEMQNSNHKIVWRRKLRYAAFAIEELRYEIPYLNEYIVGIDAASNENDTEPWMFSPVFLEARSKKNTKPYVKYDKTVQPQRIQNLGFTYHVGEDYRHVISGLRHIDEVIDKFNYKPGDRLGHAIALGVDLEYWYAENEIVAMPLIEFLEDMLWLWGMLVHQKRRLSINVDALEGRILGIARDIYRDISGINAFILYEVYQDKFLKEPENIFKEFYSRMKLEQTREVKKGKQYYFCKEYEAGLEESAFLWTKEKLLCTHFCPIYEEIYNRVVLIDKNEFSLDLLKNLQKVLIDKVESLGIYIETNPTSNTAIGEVESLYKHYITKLNSVNSYRDTNQKQQVLVTVNSDDPAVFNTNVENELSYIYHALVHAGYGKEDVILWIDKIRQYGMSASFIKKIKDPVQLIYEVNNLLELLR